MKSIVFSAAVFLSTVYASAENVTPVPAGTSMQMKLKFSIAAKATLSDLKALPNKLDCTRYDKNLKNEFVQKVTANLSVGETSATLTFEGDPNVFNLVENVAVTQSVSTVLIGDTKWEIFTTAKKSDDGSILIKGDAYKTKGANSEYLDGTVIRCK